MSKVFPTKILKGFLEHNEQHIDRRVARRALLLEHIMLTTFQLFLLFVTVPAIIRKCFRTQYQFTFDTPKPNVYQSRLTIATLVFELIGSYIAAWILLPYANALLERL